MRRGTLREVGKIAPSETRELIGRDETRPAFLMDSDWR
jgi:hypothetical protein